MLTVPISTREKLFPLADIYGSKVSPLTFAIRETCADGTAFMVTVEKLMRHGCENVPDYMISGSRGDFTGVGNVHFFYSADEVLYGALPDFEEACKRANVPYTVSARPKMVHCYCMLPIFKEAKEDFAKIVDILKK